MNAKKNTDEVAGWAFEFDKTEVQVAAGGNPPMGAPLAHSDPGAKPESESQSTSSLKTEEAAAVRTEASNEERAQQQEPVAPEEHKSRKEWETFVREKDAELADKYVEDGRFVYELYSVMVHSGSAHGGHYYAYIKDFETGKWHEFNDSRVSEKSVLDVLSVFGQELRPMKGRKRMGSHSNAYMLMYRIVDREGGSVSVVEPELIPPHLVEELEHESEVKTLVVEERMRQ